MKALLSVFDKTGIVEFAQFLAGKGVEIISTGGTKRHLQEAGLNVIDISEVTNFPEMLDGRVKTLHPKIHGGLLGVRSNQEHVSTMKEHNIEPIDIVVVNLYPFFKEVNTDKSFDEKVEFIDIGGPTMIRSAAKNFQDVAVITDVSDYQTVMNEWNETGEISFNTKKRLAGKVFNLTELMMLPFLNLCLAMMNYQPIYRQAIKKRLTFAMAKTHTKKHHSTVQI